MGFDSIYRQPSYVGKDRVNRNSEEGMKMSKPLSEMTLAELWELFPIKLTEHQSGWASWYREEEERLASVLPDTVKLHHIGSTSIGGIWAKPIIDILVEAKLRDFDALKCLIMRSGYLCMAQSQARRISTRAIRRTGLPKRCFTSILGSSAITTSYISGII